MRLKGSRSALQGLSFSISIGWVWSCHTQVLSGLEMTGGRQSPGPYSHAGHDSLWGCDLGLVGKSGFLAWGFPTARLLKKMFTCLQRGRFCFCVYGLLGVKNIHVSWHVCERAHKTNLRDVC